MKNLEMYFSSAREREGIRLRREAGELPPWTDDPVLRAWRFTNVDRERDKTTAWFREHVRSKLDGVRVVEATVIFRYFNRIETGAIVEDLLLNGWDSAEAGRRLKDVRPVVTGAYMVHSPYGMSKLEGLLAAIETARIWLPKMVGGWGDSQEQAWRDLRTIPNLGSFSAGEIVWDLRWTPVLSGARDINEWTIAGPGCARGLGYVVDGDPNRYRYGSRKSQTDMLSVMRALLELSRSPEFWPEAWDRWELHSCEMWACEFFKYMQAMAGKRLKRRFALGEGGAA